MKDRPSGFVPYKTTAVFTADTIPQALTRSHHTKAGVWGRIDVVEGSLELARFDHNGAAVAHETIRAGGSALVAPGEPHAVTLSATAAFSVTFLRQSE